MNCNVIQDLMILYTDDCCSEESKVLVEEHLKNCPACQKALADMNAELPQPPRISKVKEFSRVNLWKASLLQSILLYVSFALLVFGVFRESTTPEGSANGLWAFALIVPVTGFLLSLANWYFLRLYPSRKGFSNASLLCTAVMILLGDLWAVLHYGHTLLNLFTGSVFSTGLLILGCVLGLALILASRLAADRYARLSGKE